MVLSLIAGAWGSALGQTEEELISIYRASNAAYNAHDLGPASTLYADDFIYDGAPTPPVTHGWDAFNAFVENAFWASPDLQAIEQRILASDNILVGEWVFAGTFQEEWLGIPATGKTFQYPFLEIVEFEGDKIKRITDYYDLVSWMVQVGLMPPSELPPLTPSFTFPDPEPTGLSPADAAQEGIARFNAHDLPRFMQNIHADAEIFFAAIGVPVDRDGYAALSELYLLGFPDLTGEITRIVDLGDGWVFVDYVFDGTHDGPYFGIPATGRPIQVRNGYLQQYDADGLLTNMRAYYDNLTVLMQIGAIPAPEPSAVAPSTWGEIKSRFR